MIQIEVRVLGETVNKFCFEKKRQAKEKYCEYKDKDGCYTLVTLNGRELKLFEALGYFGLRGIVYRKNDDKKRLEKSLTTALNL